MELLNCIISGYWKCFNKNTYETDCLKIESWKLFRWHPDHLLSTTLCSKFQTEHFMVRYRKAMKFVVDINGVSMFWCYFSFLLVPPLDLSLYIITIWLPWDLLSTFEFKEEHHEKWIQDTVQFLGECFNTSLFSFTLVSQNPTGTEFCDVKNGYCVQQQQQH